MRADTPAATPETDIELALKRAKELQKGGKIDETIQEYDRLLQELGVPLRRRKIKGYDQIKPDTISNPELVLSILVEILDVYDAHYDGQASDVSSSFGDPLNRKHVIAALVTLSSYLQASAADDVNIDKLVARGNALRKEGRTIKAIQVYDEALRALNIPLRNDITKGYNKIKANTVSDLEKTGYILRNIALAYNSLDFEEDSILSAKIGSPVNGLDAARAAISLLSLARYELGLMDVEKKLAIGADLRPLYDISIEKLMDFYWFSGDPYVLLAATGYIYESRARVLTEILWSKNYLDIKIKSNDLSSQRDLIKRWILYGNLIGTINRAIKEEFTDTHPRHELLQDLLSRLENSRAQFSEMIIPVRKATMDVGFSLRDFFGIQLPYNLREEGAMLFLTVPGLREADAIVNYYVTTDYVYALVFQGVTIDPQEINVVRLKKTPDILRKDIARYLTKIREKDSAWRRVSQDLYIDIFEGIGHYLKGKKNIFVVPSGFLNDLPFQTLVDPLSNKPVTEKFGISILPSPAFISPLLNSYSWPDLPPERRALLVGVKEFDDLPELRHSESEVLAIGSAVGGDPKFLLSSKGDATRARVLKAIPDYPIVHISSHAIQDRRPMYSRIILRSPEKQDQVVTGFDLLHPELQLQPGLITLSACETGVGRYNTGEELMGLIRAFLIAGTRTVVASMWSIEEESTKILMERFYAELAKPGTSVNMALYRAQNWLRTSNKHPEYEHPYYWGGFVTYGDGRLTFRNP